MKKATLRDLLEMYSQQRRQREETRQAYKSRIKAFNRAPISDEKPFVSVEHPKYVQANSSKLSINHSNINNIEQVTEQRKQPLVKEQSELQLLLRQNKQLLNQAVELENEEKDTLVSYKKIIHEIRDKYLLEVEKMKSAADKTTSELHDKALKLRLQTEATTKKNQELQKINQNLKTDILQNNTKMGQQMTMIKQTYSAKLQEVQKIFESSNDKIQTFEKQFNQDQLVQNTLSNEQFLTNLEISAKQAEQGQSLVNEYKNLIGGKNEILEQLKANNTMKEEQINKLANIEVRMKDIARRVTQDKLLLLKENEKMVEELKEIKDLMMSKQ